MKIRQSGTMQIIQSDTVFAYKREPKRTESDVVNLYIEVNNKTVCDFSYSFNHMYDHMTEKSGWNPALELVRDRAIAQWELLVKLCD